MTGRMAKTSLLTRQISGVLRLRLSELSALQHKAAQVMKVRITLTYTWMSSESRFMLLIVVSPNAPKVSDGRSNR